MQLTPTCCITMCELYTVSGTGHFGASSCTVMGTVVTPRESRDFARETCGNTAGWSLLRAYRGDATGYSRSSQQRLKRMWFSLILASLLWNSVWMESTKLHGRPRREWIDNILVQGWSTQYRNIGNKISVVDIEPKVN